MPIVIDEVVISIEVGDPVSPDRGLPPAAAEEREALVAECVQKVLDILHQQQEA